MTMLDDMLGSEYYSMLDDMFDSVCYLPFRYVIRFCSFREFVRTTEEHTVVFRTQK